MAYNPKPTTTLDCILSEICPTLTVDIMPGENDPANITLPQQPLRSAMFPRARQYQNSTFHCVSNPHWWDLDGTILLGSSGQSIDDIYKYVEEEDRVQMMERTLRWQHMAPTCPDTLWCHPFSDKDPFIMEETPHVYFMGNQHIYSSRLVEQANGVAVRLVTIPRFSETGQLILLDLETLETQAICFKA